VGVDAVGEATVGVGVTAEIASSGAPEGSATGTAGPLLKFHPPAATTAAKIAAPTRGSRGAMRFSSDSSSSGEAWAAAFSAR